MSPQMIRAAVSWSESAGALARQLSRQHVDVQAAALLYASQRKGYFAAVEVADALKGMRS